MSSITPIHSPASAAAASTAAVDKAVEPPVVAETPPPVTVAASLAAKPAAAARKRDSKPLIRASRQAGAAAPLARAVAKVSAAEAPKTALEPARAVKPAKPAEPAKAARPAKAAKLPKVAKAAVNVQSAAGKPAPKAMLEPAKKVQAAVSAVPSLSTAPAGKEGRSKEKLVRDSFTMPRADFALIHQLKERGLGFKRAIRKSELLRAGLQALAAMDDAVLKSLLDRLPALKAGRPRKLG